MHIAHFTNTYKPNINGVVRSVSSFRDALTDLGHQVFVFSQDSPGYVDQEPFVFRYPALNIPTFDYSLTIPVSPHIDWVIPSLKLDIIHSNHPVLIGNAAADKAEKLNIPLVFTFHSRYEEYSQLLPFSQNLLRGIIVDWLVHYIERCQHIIVPSEHIRQSLIQYTEMGDCISVIPTGLNLKHYQEGDGRLLRQKLGWQDKQILVSSGRLSWEKNWKVLLTAVAEVMSKEDEIRLILIGDGPQKDDLVNFCQELGIHERVHCAGLLPFEEVPEYLKAGDLFCFASVNETQGLVTAEAMAAGLPVVAVNSIGTNEIVTNGVTGLLVENDSHALAQAINQVMGNGALFGRLKTAATKKSRAFDISAAARKIVGVYEQAVEDKKANRSIKINTVLLEEGNYQLIPSQNS